MMAGLPGEDDFVPEGPVASFTACADSMVCLTFITMSMTFIGMAQALGQNSQNTDMQVQGLQNQMAQKERMCSSESFGQLADATGGWVSLM
jgi:hypothetical protein